MSYVDKQNFISWLQDNNIKKIHPSVCVDCLETVSDYAVKHNISKISFWEISDYKQFNSVRTKLAGNKIFRFFNRNNAKNFDDAGKLYSDYLKERAEAAGYVRPDTAAGYVKANNTAVTQEINFADVVKNSYAEESAEAEQKVNTQAASQNLPPKRYVKHNTFGYGVITRTENGHFVIAFFGDSKPEREIAADFSYMHNVSESEYYAAVKNLQQGGAAEEQPNRPETVTEAQPTFTEEQQSQPEIVTVSETQFQTAEDQPETVQQEERQIFDRDAFVEHYKNWLYDVKKLNWRTKESCGLYLNTLDEYLSRRQLITKSLLASDISELTEISETLSSDVPFQEFNNAQHSGLGVALKYFIEYVKSGAAQSVREEIAAEDNSRIVQTAKLSGGERAQIANFFRNEQKSALFEKLFLYQKNTCGGIMLDVRPAIIGTKRDGEKLRFYIGSNSNIHFSHYYVDDIPYDRPFTEDLFSEYCSVIDKNNVYFAEHASNIKLKQPQPSAEQPKAVKEKPPAQSVPVQPAPAEQPAPAAPPTVRGPKYKDRYLKVLKERFEDGFRYNKFIDKNRFGIYYSEMYGEEIAEDIEDIIDFLKKHGTEIDGRLYYKDEETHNGLMDKIEKTISRTFDGGASCIYIECLFARFKQQLADDLHIYNAESFADLLINNSKTVYLRRYGYIYRAAATPDVERDVKRYMKNSYTPVTYGQIEKDLWYIPLDRIKNVLVDQSSIVRVADETYFYAANLPITESELQAVSSYINSALLQRRFIIDKELMAFIRKNCPSVLVNTDGYADWGLRNVLGYLLRREFSFNNAVISRKGERIDMIEVFADYGRSNEKITVEQLKDFAAELGTTIYWDTIHSQMVRINKDELVRKDKITFDIEATDGVLSAMIAGSYAPVGSVTLFYQFPSAGYSWNIYLLESFVANYSKKFCLLHTGFAATDCTGAIVRRGCGIDDLNSLFADVLSYDLSWKNNSGALQYLVDNGYLLRKSYRDIDTVTAKAKAIAKARKQQV